MSITVWIAAVSPMKGSRKYEGLFVRKAKPPKKALRSK
jgi:hypothetical protein